MEDVIKFLLIIGFIAIGVFKQVSKEKSKKNAENDIPVPVPPPVPQPSSVQRKSSQKANSPKKQKQFTTHIEEGVRTAHNPPTISAPPHQTDETESAETSEYTIDSPEEARRAIIWSEILQRKF